MNIVTTQVRDLYAAYPYPPLEQAVGFPLLASLDYVACVMWPRRRSLAGLRVLDAGCGTGHVAVELARRHPEVEVIGLDLSPTALAIARQRAQQGDGPPPNNLRFCEGAIEDLARLPVGDAPFDYIVSSGVLHHLADPVGGARTLGRHLAPEGVIGLMVYAPHGRHGVYVLQELLRRIAGSRPLPEQVAIARQLLAALPPEHPFRAKEFVDQDWAGDAGLVDLLLHVRDRSFTVPELRTLLDAAELRIRRFWLPYVYRPESYLPQGSGEPSLLHAAASSPSAPAAPSASSGGPADDPAAIAELLTGTMRMHVALVCHDACPAPLTMPLGTADAFTARPMRSPLLRWEERRGAGREARSASHSRHSAHRGSAHHGGGHRPTKGRAPAAAAIHVNELSYTGRARELVLEGESALFLERADGTRTAEEIFNEPAMQSALAGETVEQKRQRLAALVAFLVREDLLFLRA